MSVNSQKTNTELDKLSDTGLELADPAQDIRGRKVVDRHGDELGHVSHLFIDREEKKVRMLEVRAGGFLGIGDRHFLLPVDAISRLTGDDVEVNQTRERIVQAPMYDPKLFEIPTREYVQPLYGFYGFSPYWNPGYMYPQFPRMPRRHENRD